MQVSFECSHGGTGRRKGLKIPRSQGRAGSIPAESTTSPSTSSHSGFSVPIHWHPSPNIYSVIPSRSYRLDNNWKETDGLGFDTIAIGT